MKRTISIYLLSWREFEALLAFFFFSSSVKLKSSKMCPNSLSYWSGVTSVTIWPKQAWIFPTWKITSTLRFKSWNLSMLKHNYSQKRFEFKMNCFMKYFSSLSNEENKIINTRSAGFLVNCISSRSWVSLWRSTFSETFFGLKKKVIIFIF